MVNYGIGGFFQNPFGYIWQAYGIGGDFWKLGLGTREEQVKTVLPMYQGLGLVPEQQKQKVFTLIDTQKQQSQEANKFWNTNVYAGSNEVIPDIANPLKWGELIAKYGLWIAIGFIAILLITRK